MKLDWRQHWFESVHEIGQGFASLPDNVAATLNECAARASQAKAHTSLKLPHFTSQSALPEGEAYEAFIYRTNQVPTRNNAHDFFNGLMWLAMPQAKRALNKLQAAQIAHAGGVHATRGAARDAATLFDENGAILVTQEQRILDAWQQHDWQRLFVTLRDAWLNESQSVRLLIFGHATLEKCLKPYKAITTHTLWLNLPHDSAQAVIDEALANNIERIAAKDWHPLPIMGVPGWWPHELGEQDAAFYADEAVFRRQASRR